jgi:hypothetical protein
VTHCESLPIPELPDVSPLDCDEEEENTPEETWQSYTSGDPKFFLNVTSAEPHKITQKELSDPIRNLKLSKNKGELLSSRPQQLNILDGTVTVTAFRSRKKIFSCSS